MKGLALEGGGGKGSYEIGAYIALKELGFDFDAVAGTSIGSLNAALIVQGDMDLAKRLWLTADSEMVGINKDIVKNFKEFKISKENIKLSLKEVQKLIKNKGLDISKYVNTIQTYIDEEKIRNSKMNYGLVTVRIKDLKPLELTIKEIEKGKLSEYIMASSYLPVFKMNKIIDNSYYLDGGISNNLPITLLEKMGCNDIIAIKINGVGLNKKKLITKTKTTIIEPTKNTGPVIMFDNKDITNNFYMGYYDTLLYYNKVEGYTYYFKKFKFYNLLTRKINNNLLNLIKIRYRTPEIKETVLKSIEELLTDNNIYYYKIYKITKILKYIKNNKLKAKNSLITEFVYQLKII